MIGLGPITTVAFAADADLPVKAPPVVVDTPWWTHGFVEFGGRDFLNDPNANGRIWQGQRSLAKFYEYKSEKPGPFGDFYVATGSGNGLHEVDLWGQNVGYNDQRYNAYWSKAGEQYLNFQWDQTPHVYSTSASTLFNTNGNALTLINPNFGNQLHTILGGAAWPSTLTPTQANNFSTFINSQLAPTNIAIRRETASVDYRYTPNDNWDIKANYSHLRRTGSQVDSVLFTDTNTGSRVDVAKPVDDTTQNFGVNGEYIGVSPWGQRVNAMVGYLGSVYTDAYSNYTVQNPFCFGATPTCAGQGNTTSPVAMMSTPPSNNMNAGTGTVGMDLPLNSRYMGTVTYSGMRQNEQFLPFAFPGNGVLLANGSPAGALSSLPAQSLNGQINTLLVNNVLTTQVNPNLKTKVSYRYYDYDNQTPQITIPDWVIADAASTITAGHAGYAPVNPLMVGYIKQDAAAEATWRPVNTVNLGALYNYEHYDFTRFDASSTAENTGKVYADWRPQSWVTFRASGSYGERRASNYDYLGNVGMFQWPTPRAVSATAPTPWPNSTNYSPYYRQFYLDGRDRAQAKFQVDVDVVRGLVVTPTVTWRNDEFLIDPNQLGLTHDRSTAVGVEVGYAATPDLKLLFSYMNEQRNQFMWSSSTSLAPYSFNTVNGGTAYYCPGNATTCQLYSSNIQDRVNTFIFGLNYMPIPERLEFGVTYTASYAKNSSPLIFQNGTGPIYSGLVSAGGAATGTIAGMQFPDVTTLFQRVDATAKYVVDPSYTASIGLKGQVAFRLRYAWERNSVTNWNNDWMQPWMYPVLLQNQAIYYQSLAQNNPNYNVHMIGGTVSYAW